MILLCDESISPQVPDALRQQGHEALSFHDLGWLGEPDVIWLPKAGRLEDVLVLSRDRMMLHKQEEFEAIRDYGVSIVFLTAGQQPVESVIPLVLGNWTQLEQLSDNTPRPFIRFLTTTGNLRERFHGRDL